jgi:hypothetical protein
MEELWNCFSDSSTFETPSMTQEDSDSGEDLMAISIQALNGTEGSKTIRLRGFLASKVSGWQPLPSHVHVTVANGAEILCAYELPNLMWEIQGHTFQCSFKIIPLGCYDAILGMDWLSSHSPMNIH